MAIVSDRAQLNGNYRWLFVIVLENVARQLLQIDRWLQMRGGRLFHSASFLSHVRDRCGGYRL